MGKVRNHAESQSKIAVGQTGTEVKRDPAIGKKNRLRLGTILLFGNQGSINKCIDILRVSEIYMLQLPMD